MFACFAPVLFPLCVLCMLLCCRHYWNILRLNWIWKMQRSWRNAYLRWEMLDWRRKNPIKWEMFCMRVLNLPCCSHRAEMTVCMWWWFSGTSTFISWASSSSSSSSSNSSPVKISIGFQLTNWWQMWSKKCSSFLLLQKSVLLRSFCLRPDSKMSIIWYVCYLP